MAQLEHEGLTALPLVHGRMAFAIEVRRRLLSERWDAIAVELPPSHDRALAAGLDLLPRVGAVFSGDRPTFLPGEEPFIGYVPLDPADAIIEALRIARGERIPVHFVDAEVDEPEPRPLVLPDAHVLLGLDLGAWYSAVLPWVARLRRPTELDRRREAHMAARLHDLLALRRGMRVLLLCGLGHWEGVRAHLEAGTGHLDASESSPSWVRYEPLSAPSLPHVMSELPNLIHRYERHRSGIAIEDFDASRALREMLIEARDLHRRRFPDSMEQTSIERLQKLLAYARKLTVVGGRLIPDAYTLGTAAKGTVGNDFALALLATANHYPPNAHDGPLPATPDEPNAAPPGAAGDPEPVTMTESRAELEGDERAVTPRAPGEARSWRPLELKRPPERRLRQRWREGWNPYSHCSWPPEDVRIENFRDYVTKRALTMAGIAQVKTEPFTTSFKDGLAIRETLRDWHRRKIHVKEEPRVAGEVGAIVMVFEEDDLGLRFPWRTTWMAEHEEESTLAFYATDPREDLVGPGIGRMHYGGCLFIYPPILIPDVWDDLRFERARRPSERLLLAGIYHSRDRYVVHVAHDPPPREMRAEADRFGRHLIHLPLRSFGARTLEQLRRAHVLNGRQAREWAARYIP